MSDVFLVLATAIVAIVAIVYQRRVRFGVGQVQLSADEIVGDSDQRKGETRREQMVLDDTQSSQTKDSKS